MGATLSSFARLLCSCCLVTVFVGWSHLTSYAHLKDCWSESNDRLIADPAKTKRQPETEKAKVRYHYVISGSNAYFFRDELGCGVETHVSPAYYHLLCFYIGSAVRLAGGRTFLD